MPLPLNETSQATRSATEWEVDPPLLTDPDGQFARNFNRRQFQFPHGLKNHPLFELPNLIELAKRPSLYGAYWSNGTVEVTDAEREGLGPARQMTLLDTITHIGDNNSAVNLMKVADDPVFGPLLKDCLERIVVLVGEQFRQEVVGQEASIIITSPNRLTAYHMDVDCNFLMQVVGDKTLWVYDQNDRAVVSHEQREVFHCGNPNSISYQESQQAKATAYDLHGGVGVHIPVFAPHWARNHDNISVAVAFMFELRSMHNQKRIYQVNRALRKFGAAPTPPGISPWRDHMKLAAAKRLHTAYHLLRSRRA